MLIAKHTPGIEALARGAPIVSVPLKCPTCGGRVAIRYRFDQRLPREFHRWKCPYNDCRGASLVLVSGELIDASVHTGPIAKDA